MTPKTDFARLERPHGGQILAYVSTTLPEDYEGSANDVLVYTVANFDGIELVVTASFDDEEAARRALAGADLSAHFEGLHALAVDVGAIDGAGSKVPFEDVLRGHAADLKRIAAELSEVALLRVGDEHLSELVDIAELLNDDADEYEGLDE